MIKANSNQNPPDRSVAPADALIQLVRLLARAAVRSCLAEPAPDRALEP
jgi:hypothetical protein